MMRKRQKAGENDDNGFAEFGGYMSAKINKLANQYARDAAMRSNDAHNNNNIDNITGSSTSSSSSNKNDKNLLLFNGISVYVNGLTDPSAEEIKQILMKYGGIYHTYLNSMTTFHIASNLPNVKLRQLEKTTRSQTKIIIPQWIVDCVQQQKLLDYSYYLLSNTNTNYLKPQSKGQPKIMFGKQPQHQQHNSLTATSAVTTATADDTNANFQFDDDGDADDGDADDGDCEYIENCRNYEEMESPPSSSSIQNQDAIEQNNQLLLPVTLLNDDDEQDGGDDDTTKKCDIEINNKQKITTSTIMATKESETACSATTQLDSNLLETYLKNSRLHLISQMAFEYKSLIRIAREQHNGQFPNRQNLLGKLTALNPLTEYIDIPDNIIMHIDMDCFFVSVGLLSRPHLIGKPVAVSHSKGNPNNHNHNKFTTSSGITGGNLQSHRRSTDEIPSGDKNASDNNQNNFKSFSEIASCSYEARAKGVKNGMFVETALSLCPELQLIPYDFEKYRKVGDKFYAILLRYTLDIEAVSCDEMYVNLTELIRTMRISFIDFVTFIRNEIHKETNCNCSAGIGNNRLQARMATKSAKPNGQFYLESFEVNQYFSDIKISDLPDVGQTKSKILWSELGAKTCGDLQSITLAAIQQAVGKRAGNQLFEYCRGIDNSQLNYVQINKSVSVNLNYGIRITTPEEFDGLLKLLSKEIHKRLVERHQITRQLSVKFMIRKKNAPKETPKYLGHGVCDTVSRSIQLTWPTNDCDKIFEACKNVRATITSNPSDLRGISIHSYKLEANNNNNNKQSTTATGEHPNALRDMFNKANEKQKRRIAEQQQKQQPNADHFLEEYEQQQQMPILIEDHQQNSTSSNSSTISRNSNSSESGSRSIISHPQFVDNNYGNIQNTDHQQQQQQQQQQQKPCRINPLRRISNNIKPTDRNVVDPVHLLNQTVDIYKGIDMNVLNELPEDIRQEILNDCKQIESYAPIVQPQPQPQNQPPQQQINPARTRQMMMNAKGQTNNKNNNTNNSNNSNRRFKSILVPPATASTSAPSASTSSKSSTPTINELHKFIDYPKIKPQSTSASTSSSAISSNNFGKVHADFFALIPPDVMDDAREIEEQRKMLEMYSRNVKKDKQYNDGGLNEKLERTSTVSSNFSSASATVTSSSAASASATTAAAPSSTITADDGLHNSNIIQCNLIKKPSDSQIVIRIPPDYTMTTTTTAAKSISNLATNSTSIGSTSSASASASSSFAINGGSHNNHNRGQSSKYPSSSASSSTATVLFRPILRISDDNLLNKDDWRQCLQSWLANTNRPQSKDIEIFIGYAIEFIRADQLNDIYKCFCHFFRIINDDDDCSCEWHRSYKTIVDGFQTEMMRIYKSKLFINTSFRCTKCQ